MRSSFGQKIASGGAEKARSNIRYCKRFIESIRRYFFSKTLWVRFPYGYSHPPSRRPAQTAGARRTGKFALNCAESNPLPPLPDHKKQRVLFFTLSQACRRCIAPLFLLFCLIITAFRRPANQTLAPVFCHPDLRDAARHSNRLAQC